ncbi:GerAB/ArcD/ProY family transporter [Halobacillus campisalis]|uniref:Endospore germination permease n=1 Tax=Halobacillus campisalis TaxID=435909 RepID=A0ABW2K062_9BACI|nr:endospore germination permease [Halobacillus campisalis]
MSGQTNQKISRRQFFFVIIQTQIGVGILALPFDLHDKVKQDGWISLLIAGVVIQLLLFLLWWLAKRFPSKDYFQIQEYVLSRWLGKVTSFLYVLYFCSVGILIVLIYGRLISIWVLPNTPFWVLAFMMVFICLYMVCCSLLVIARLYTMFAALLIIMVIFIFYSAKDSKFMYIFPIGEAGLTNIIAGIDMGILSFLGFIVALVLYSKTEGTAKEKLVTIQVAQAFVFTFYLAIVLVTFTFFSTQEMALVPEPVLYMLKSYEFPIVARIDLFFISTWIVFVATSLSTYLLMSALGLTNIFQSLPTKWATIGVAVIIFITASYMGYDISKLNNFNTYVKKGGYIFSIGLPLMVLIFSFFRKSSAKEGTSS